MEESSTCWKWKNKKIQIYVKLKPLCQTLTYLVSGDGIGDIEAGVPETGDKGVEAEMAEQLVA